MTKGPMAYLAKKATEDKLDNMAKADIVYCRHVKLKPQATVQNAI